MGQPSERAPEASSEPRLLQSRRSKASFEIPGSRDTVGLTSSASLGKLKVNRVVLQPKLAAPTDHCLLTELFRDRVRVLDVPLPLPAGADLPGPIIDTFMGNRYELAAADVRAVSKTSRIGQRTSSTRCTTWPPRARSCAPSACTKRSRKWLAATGKRRPPRAR